MITARSAAAMVGRLGSVGVAGGGSDLVDKCSGPPQYARVAEQSPRRVDCGGDLAFREAAEVGQHAPLRAWL